MIYFDNAATTQRKPDCVVQAVTEALCSLGNPGRSVHGGAMNASRIVFDARLALAELFGAEGPDRIAFTANSTEALNTALKGILNPGDHVITTALEHNSVLRPLYELEDRGMELTILPADPLGNIRYEDFAKAIRSNTKAIVTTHGSNLTGNLLDIGRIGANAKEHCLLYIVDASQTAGVFPIDVQKMHIDILCFTGHKGLLGPQGTGILLCREGGEPLLYGGTGSVSKVQQMPEELPDRLEAGTLNVPGYAGLREGLRYLNQTGVKKIFIREHRLMQQCAAGLREIGMKVFSGPHQAATVSFLPGLDCEEAAEKFARQGIAVRAGLHCAPYAHESAGTLDTGTVRVSIGYDTFESQIAAFLRAASKLPRF